MSITFLIQIFINTFFTMKLKQIFLMFLFIGFSLSSSSQVGFGESQKINSNWKFILNDIPEAKEKDFNDWSWQNVDLPHDWSVKQQLSPTVSTWWDRVVSQSN